MLKKEEVTSSVRYSNNFHKVLLVVDDEPDICCVLKAGLESHGYVVSVFTDAEVALYNFKPCVYNLAILDVLMPKMSGYDLYIQLMKIDPKLKVIFLTASDLEFPSMTSLHFISLCEMHLLRKPVSLHHLKEKIENMLKKC
jgi:DNA-binding response OmpR family regulator